MKLKIKSVEYSLKPKQSEGKIVVDSLTYSVKPKPDGVQIRKNPVTYVLKHDRRSGVVIQKQKQTTVCKASVYFPPIDRFPQVHSNTQVWTNVADKPVGSEDSIQVGLDTTFVIEESLIDTYYNIGTTVYGLESINQAAVRWTGVIIDRESDYEMTVEITEVDGALSAADPYPQYWIITKEYLDI